MATCPPDRACATPTPSQAQARPSGMGNPRQTQNVWEGCWDQTVTFPAVLQSRGWRQPRAFGKRCQAKLPERQRSCEQRFQENKTNPHKCLQHKTCALLCPLPSPRLSRAVQCVCTQTDRRCASGDRQQKPFCPRDAHGTNGAAPAQTLLWLDPFC